MMKLMIFAIPCCHWISVSYYIARSFGILDLMLC
uniref:Uncharacterized protein n=1 Tax=Triticum urartu TaxID=4572 RepID=A0A8R7QN30_TRIUA